MVSVARMAASEPIGSRHARPGSTPERSGDPEAERVEPHIDMAPDAGRRADALAVVAPGTAADDPEAWIAAREPRRPVRRRRRRSRASYPQPTPRRCRACREAPTRSA